MRSLRREILYLCKYRMDNVGHGNVDALVVLLHKLLRKVVVRRLPAAKRKGGRLLRDALKVILETVHLLKGRGGAASVIYSAFSGRAGSALMRQLMKMFEGALTVGGRQQRQSVSSGGGRDSRFWRRVRFQAPFPTRGAL